MRGVGVWGVTLSIPDKATLLPEPQPNLSPSVAGAVGAIVAVIAAVIGVVVWKSKSGKGPDLLRIAPDMSPMLTLILSAGKEKKKGYEAPAGECQGQNCPPPVLGVRALCGPSLLLGSQW